MTMRTKEFFAGTIVGPAGGIFGNILVTSMYRMIDGEQRGNNALLF